MENRTNTIFGWVLFAAGMGLGLSILSGKYFHADANERPEVMGFAIEGVEAEGAGDSGPSLAMLLAEGDAAAGATAAISRCGTCHSFNSGGAPGTGPNLYGVLGKPIGGHAPGFAYSSALSGKGGAWDYGNMDEWLKSPRAFANGTKMSFAGLGSGEDRANIILYLREMGGGPALPEYVEEVPEEATAEDEAEAVGEDEAVSEEDAALEAEAIATEEPAV